MYKIKDLQFDCRYFGGDEGIEFKTKEEIRKQLISYHSNDYTGETDIETYTLAEILDYGQWEIEEVEAKNFGGSIW